MQALTPSEFRVARLAARPMGNREIAQARFITTKTVSDHRSSAYRKLNIQSRDQLATVMSAEQIVNRPIFCFPKHLHPSGSSPT